MTVNATVEIDTINCGLDEAFRPRGRWYSFDGDGLSPITLSVCVTSGNISTPIALNGRCGDLVCMGNDELNVEEIHTNIQCNVEYRLSLQTENIDYWFLVYDTNEYTDGGAEFSISLFSNDVCEGAFLLDISNNDLFQVSTIHGREYSSSEACVGSSKSNPGVFYKLVGSGAEIKVTACTDNPSQVESQLALFTGNCSSLLCSNVNIIPGVCGSASSMSWLSSVGAVYYLRVSSEVAMEKINLSISLHHDSCEAARQVMVGEVVVGTTIGAADQDAYDDCVGNQPSIPGNGVWFVVEGTGQALEATTCVVDPSTFELIRILIAASICTQG